MLKRLIIFLFLCSLAFGQDTQIHPYLAPRGGLRMDLPGNLISDTEMTDCQNVFLERGYVKKRYGYSELGDNLPLPGQVIGSDQFYLFTASADYLLTMTTLGCWKYDSNNDYWKTIMTKEQEDDCETTWTAKTNVTVADDTTDYKEGSTAQKISPDANFTTGILAYRDQALGDKSAYGVVRLWVKSSIALTAGQLEFVISNAAACASEDEHIDIPAMSADTWYLWFVAIATPSGIDSVDSLGLKATADFGACDIRIDDIHFVTVFSSNLEYDADSTDLCAFDYIRDIAQIDPWWIMTNGVDELWYWTGGSSDLTALITDFPSGVTSLTCRELIEFKDHLLLLDVSEDADRYPQRIRWSDTADPCDFLNGNASYQDLGGADWIQCAVKFKGDYLVIFKERSIWVGYATGDSDIFQFDQRVTGAGCAAAKTVESLGDELIFLGWDDVYVFNGIDYESIGSTIQNELFDTMDPGAIDKCFGVVIEEQKEYWLFTPSISSDYCDQAWVFNYELNKWTKHDFAAVDGTTNGISCYGYYEKQAGLTIGDLSGTIGEQTWRFGDREVLEAAPTTLFGDTDGYIYEYDRIVSNDDGTTIDAWFSTKDFMFTNLMERQVILRMDVYFGGEGDLKIAYSTDFGSTWENERTLSGQDTYDIDRAYWRIDCPLVRFRFRNNNAGEHFDFREARIYWQPSGRRF